MVLLLLLLIGMSPAHMSPDYYMPRNIRPRDRCGSSPHFFWPIAACPSIRRTRCLERAWGPGIAGVFP